MRGKKALQLRKMIYGTDFSPRFRKYRRNTKGVISADQKRQQYQLAKKLTKGKQLCSGEKTLKLILKND